jgi:RNA polymerase sigma-70 factor (ECF subfamily)
MHTTPASLLVRLRRPDDQEAWGRFVRLYTPLLYHWARRLRLPEADAADLVQDVFAVLVRTLPGFEYDRRKGFRGWLKTVVTNKFRDRCRRRAAAPPAEDGALADVAGPDPADALSDAEYNQYLAAQALRLMQAEFQPATWKACWEHAVNARPAADVARELGLSVNAVYLAKSRVLRRLRQALDGLLD